MKGLRYESRDSVIFQRKTVKEAINDLAAILLVVVCLFALFYFIFVCFFLVGMV